MSDAFLEHFAEADRRGVGALFRFRIAEAAREHLLLTPYLLIDQIHAWLTTRARENAEAVRAGHADHATRAALTNCHGTVTRLLAHRAEAEAFAAVALAAHYPPDLIASTAALVVTVGKAVTALERLERWANDDVDAAYWAFTRQARAKPPCLVVPFASKLLPRVRAARAALRCYLYATAPANS